MDTSAQQQLLARMDALPAGQNYFDDVLDAELRPSYRPTRDWANHRPEPSKPANVMVFSSGFGDGAYSNWWGFAGEVVCCLVTDFEVL